jgi:hypothetical protein
MNRRFSLLVAACSLLIASACGDDQTVEPGANQNPATDGGADATGVIVQVSYDGSSVPVDLGTLPTTSYKGVNLVKLSDVWAASQIGVDPATLEFEFVSSDGFKPSSKGCVDLPGTAIDKGYIDPSSRNVSWDEVLGLRGCYSVTDTAQMNGHAPTDAGVTDAASE